MKVRYLTFEAFHGRGGIGSTRLRVHNLLKHWPEAELYKYGEKPDVMVFQKVYISADYKFPAHFKGIKILDICDPDWLQGSAIKETVDAMDGVTTSAPALAEFIRQMTDKPVREIKDRHEPVPNPKKHEGPLKKLVWFGYKQNAELLRFVIPSLEKRGLGLDVISNDNPMVWKWADNPDRYQDLCSFAKHSETTLMDDLKAHDAVVIPVGNRPHDRFKSNNRITRAWWAGLPVITNTDDLERFDDPNERNKEAKANYKEAQEEYNVTKSVDEMKDFIEELKRARG